MTWIVIHIVIRIVTQNGHPGSRTRPKNTHRLGFGRPIAVEEMKGSCKYPGLSEIAYALGNRGEATQVTHFHPARRRERLDTRQPFHFDDS